MLKLLPATVQYLRVVQLVLLFVFIFVLNLCFMENVFHWVDGEHSMTLGMLKHHNQGFRYVGSCRISCISNVALGSSFNGSGGYCLV